MSIEVFKTNVLEVSIANKLTALLIEHFPGNKINFDMHDCDKILRVEGENFITSKVRKVVEENGFACSALE
jgi:hypothetical protein